MDVQSTYGETFFNKSGKTDNSTLKEAKLIGIYFSAHWCPPCRGFTPKLAEFYNNVNANGKVFEVIFSSCDKDEESFQEYLATMPWIALPLKDPKCNQLSGKFDVSGIPRLVILNQDGKVVNGNARGDVEQGAKTFDKWLKSDEKSNKVVDPAIWTEIKNGKKVICSAHEHEVEWVNSTQKVNPAYAEANWECNDCGDDHAPTVANLHCGQCDFDLCDKCYEQLD
jgi:nucleoredoxin